MLRLRRDNVTVMGNSESAAADLDDVERLFYRRDRVRVGDSEPLVPEFLVCYRLLVHSPDLLDDLRP